MNWSDLSMSQRSELISIYLKNGITSLDEMKKHYNSFAEGGSIDDPPFTKRYSEGQRRAIPTSQGPATHYLAVDEVDGKYYAYPTVQPIDYNDTNSPLKYYGDRAFYRALENNDVMPFNLLDDAIRYSENYKRLPSTGAYLNNDNTPAYSPYDYVRSFAKGGKIDIPPYWGQPVGQKESPIDYLSRYVNSQAFAKRAPNKAYIQQAKRAVKDFNGVTNSQWREHSIGPHINEYNNTITMYPGRIDTPYAPYEYSFEAPYMAVLAHEYGHLLDPNYGKENNVPKSYTDLYKNIIPEANSHDSRPDEIYADLQSLRYQLYENNIFDIINDGTFNESHLDKALKQGVPNRLLYTMPKEAIIQMMNIIADSGSNDTTANIAADGGKIHIKPENRGKFTALKKRTGHSASWFKEHGTPAQKKMAVFELNSKKWRK